MCFVHVHYLGNKLSSQALKFVFVGYSRTHKVYKCFHPPLHKFYVSVDVTFFDSTPYFLPHGTSHDESILEALPSIPLLSPLESSSPPPNSNELDVSQGVDTFTPMPTYLSKPILDPPLLR